jgi:hypothetical protein
VARDAEQLFYKLFRFKIKLFLFWRAVLFH